MAARIIPSTGTELTTIPTRPAAPETRVLATRAAARSVITMPSRTPGTLPLAVQQHMASFLDFQGIAAYANTNRATRRINVVEIQQRQLVAQPVTHYPAGLGTYDLRAFDRNRPLELEAWNAFLSRHPQARHLHYYNRTGGDAHLPATDLVKGLPKLESVSIHGPRVPLIVEDTLLAFASKCTQFDLTGWNLDYPALENAVVILVQACPHMTSIKLRRSSIRIVETLTAQCQKLQTISLGQAFIHPLGPNFEAYEQELIKLIQASPELISIQLPFVSVKILEALAKHCPKLQSLSCPVREHLIPNRDPSVIEEGILQLIQACPNLTSIQLPYVSEKILNAIAERCPKLQSISLRQGNISAGALINFLQRNPLITSVTVEGQCCISGLEKVDLGRTCPQVTTLDLQRWDGPQAEALRLMGICPEVRSLALNGRQIRDPRGAIATVAARLPHLQHFTLTAGRQAAIPGKDLIPLAKCPELVTLRVDEFYDRSESSVDAFKALARGCSHLTSIRNFYKWFGKAQIQEALSKPPERCVVS